MFFIIKTTFPLKKQAKNLAKILFDNRLLSCAQISKTLSLYTWNGKLCKQKEYTISIKTTKPYIQPIISLIKAHYCYEIPEIIISKAESKNKAYSTWLESTLSQTPSSILDSTLDSELDSVEDSVVVRESATLDMSDTLASAKSRAKPPTKSHVKSNLAKASTSLKSTKPIKPIKPNKSK